MAPPPGQVWGAVVAWLPRISSSLAKGGTFELWWLHEIPPFLLGLALGLLAQAALCEEAALLRPPSGCHRRRTHTANSASPCSS